MKLRSAIYYQILFICVSLLSWKCATDEDPGPINEAGPSKTVIQDTFEGEEFVVYANKKFGMIQAYSRRSEEGTLLDFRLGQGAFPSIMTDNEGNLWNIFGIAVSGPREGQKLQVMNNMMGYWFSFAAMYPEVSLYGEPEKESLILEAPNSDWLIDPRNVFAATFKDAIQSLDFPEMEVFNTPFKNENYIENEELVLVYSDGLNIRVFPHKILDWHEVVNDRTVNGDRVISYCPLTGTASLWNSVVQGNNLSFGVSGLLYNSNLILYDRSTDSNWPQMLQKSVFGEFKEIIPEVLPHLEMTWEAARMLAQNVLVLSEDTGFTRDYDEYPYGDYRTNNNFISYPLNFEDDRVPNKERVLAVIINNKAKVYRFKDFE